MSILHTTPLLPFIGSEIEPDYTTAKVVILPIPYEATTTYRRGCVNGPAVLLDASQQLECYDEELDRETGLEVGIYECQTKDGKKFTVTAPGNAQERHDHAQNGHKNIGRSLTVKYFNYTPDGVPYLPVALRIREDI